MNQTSNLRSRPARWAGAAGLVMAGVVGGGVLASSLGANAATTTPTSNSSTSTREGAARTNYPAHGTAAHEALEKPVSGANATKAQSAAVKAVGSGTAGAMTTDVSGNGYEVPFTKSDGTRLGAFFQLASQETQVRMDAV